MPKSTSSSSYYLYHQLFHHLYHHQHHLLYHHHHNRQRATATSSWVGGKVWKWDYFAEIHHGPDHWYRGGYYDDDSNMIMMVVGMIIVIVVIVKILGQGCTLNLRLKRYHCPKIQTKIQLDNWGHFDDNVNNDSTFFRLTSLQTTGVTLSWSCVQPMGKHILQHKSVSWKIHSLRLGNPWNT